MSFVVTAWHSGKLICGRGWPVSAVPVLSGSAGGCWGTVPPPVLEVLGAGQRDGWVGGSRGPCVPLNIGVCWSSAGLSSACVWEQIAGCLSAWAVCSNLFCICRSPRPAVIRVLMDSSVSTL